MGKPTLLQHLSTYPGGIAQLALDAGLSQSTVYGFAGAERLNISPVTARAISKALRGRKSFFGAKMTLGWLVAEWQKAKEMQG